VTASAPSDVTGINDAVFHVYGPGTAGDLLPVVVDVYRDGFADDEPAELEQGIDWLTDAWPRRITTPGFRLVTATIGQTSTSAATVGAVYGHQLLPITKWWDEADPPPPAEITTERPGRTFAIIDMMVRGGWRRLGIAGRMHTLLLASGAEERSTLLVEPSNVAALAAYDSWGYDQVTTIQPAAFPDSPAFAALIRLAQPPAPGSGS
jgi:GNAT superfamily N-acetyltransferase